MPPDPRLAATVARMSRATEWRPLDTVALQFDAGHPQGMVRVDGTWWISTVDLTRRAGWVLAVDDAGDLLHKTPVGDGVRFHPGGMDFDGAALWVASSEYRPRSTAAIERLVPDGVSRPEVAFDVAEHVGAVIRLGPDGDLVGWTWGSRRFLRWAVDGTKRNEVRNPAHFIDHQDGQWVGGDFILCAGVATVTMAAGPSSLGGLGLLRASDLLMTRECPFPHHSTATGRAATQNPIFAEVVGDAMVVHLLPDDGAGVIYSYSTPLVVTAD